jgi:hypothetical protein
LRERETIVVPRVTSGDGGIDMMDMSEDETQLHETTTRDLGLDVGVKEIALRRCVMRWQAWMAQLETSKRRSAHESVQTDNRCCCNPSSTLATHCLEACRSLSTLLNTQHTGGAEQELTFPSMDSKLLKTSRVLFSLFVGFVQACGHLLSSDWMKVCHLNRTT